MWQVQNIPRNGNMRAFFVLLWKLTWIAQQCLCIFLVSPAYSWWFFRVGGARQETEEIGKTTFLKWELEKREGRVSDSCNDNRELKQRRRRRQREGHKTIGLMNKNNSSARAFYVLYISLPSSPKQQRGMTKFKVLWRTWAHDGQFFILLPYFNAIPINLVPGYYAYIVQVERIGIMAKS